MCSPFLFVIERLVMFESIRKHSKIAMFAMFLLIIPAFVLVGIDSSYFSGGSPVVAKVDGGEITQAEWDAAHRQEADRIRAQQPDMDGALLDSPQARYRTLDRLVRERVYQAAANAMHLQPSDTRLARELQEIPQIAALRRPDGSLDAEAYRQLAATQGLTPEGFEANMRRQLALNQVMGSVINTSFATPAQAKAALVPLFQEREVRIASFLPEDFVAGVKPSDQDLQAYYQQHVAQYQQPEQIDIQYVVLSLDVVRAGITLSEGDLRTYYKENIAQYSGKEERRVSHMLVAVSKDAPASAKAAAKEKAELLLKEVREAPQSFAEVAKKNSEDPGSATQGGDLGLIARGAMVKPFEDAAFALDEGAISDVIETDFGFHILKAVAIKKPLVPTFEEKRAEIEEQLLGQMAQRKFAEVAESFANTVYEQADSLEPVAKKRNLTIQTATGIQRNAMPTDAGVLSSPKLHAALFSPDSLEQKRNTEAVESGPSELVSARVTKYTPARSLTFDEAKAEVQSQFIAEKSAQLARESGANKLAAWMKDDKSAADATVGPIVVSRQNLKGQPSAVVDRVMGLQQSALPTWVGIDLGAQGYRVVQVIKVMDEKPAPKEAQSQRMQQYTQQWSAAEALAYYELLKRQFKVQFKVPKPV